MDDLVNLLYEALSNPSYEGENLIIHLISNLKRLLELGAKKN